MRGVCRLVVRRYYSEPWKPLETVRQCDLCGKNDIVHVISAPELCPACFRRSNLNFNTKEALLRVTAIGASQCHVCKRWFNVGVRIIPMYVCWRCLWHRFGGHPEPLKIGGTRIT